MALVYSHEARGLGIPQALGIGETHTEEAKAARPKRRAVNFMVSEKASKFYLGEE